MYVYASNCFELNTEHISENSKFRVNALFKIPIKNKSEYCLIHYILIINNIYLVEIIIFCFLLFII